MKNILKVFIFLIFINKLHADGSSCDLIENQEIFYQKNNKRIEFNYKEYIFNLADKSNKNCLAIMWKVPKNSQMRDERYFILDYKNMVVYDNDDCLNADLIMFNDAKKIELHYFDKEEVVSIFKQKKYNNCKKTSR